MYLLDTVVLSELRKARRDLQVRNWFRTVDPSTLFISVITFGQIERGVERQRQIDAGFADRLAAWSEAVLRLYADRVLPVTASIARRWGRLLASERRPGVDLLIAATALDHGLAVVTRNTRDFVGLGVEVIDPFQRK